MSQPQPRRFVVPKTAQRGRDLLPRFSHMMPVQRLLDLRYGDRLNWLADKWTRDAQVHSLFPYGGYLAELAARLRAQTTELVARGDRPFPLDNQETRP